MNKHNLDRITYNQPYYLITCCDCDKVYVGTENYPKFYKSNKRTLIANNISYRDSLPFW